MLAWFIFFSAASAALMMHDPLVIGQTFMAGSTDPTSGSTAWALTSHGISEKLFTVDQDGNVVPQIAESVTKVDTMTWQVTVRSGYSFSDSTEVTPQHVVDALMELNQQNPSAQASAGSMTVTVVDGKVQIVTERATPVMDAVLAEWVFVIYLVKSGERYFTGPYAVETFVEGDHIDLIPNIHYPRAAERPLLTIKKYSTGHEAATALENNEVDMAFHLPIDTLTDLRAVSGITVKSFLVGYHYMMWHNTQRAPLNELAVREAIDMAVDRQELTQELRGGSATRHLFPENTPYGDALDDAAPYADTSGAETKLSNAGWVKNANGIREKNGEQLSVGLVAYPQRPGLVVMQPVIHQTLTDLGFAVNSITTSGDSWDQLDEIIAQQNFNLMLWAQHTLPAGDPQWFLNAFFRSDGGNNHAGLNSSAIDGLLDDLAHTDTAMARVTATTAAHEAILAEVPVSNIVTPSWHVGLSSRLSDYEPWGADYYIVRADFAIGALSTITTTSGSDVSSARRGESFHFFASILMLSAGVQMVEA